ncbi:MBL fold metallo-hydrolase [Streptomyces spirodelae]|uniref:MBL fold metallo-hydrolase n=1 Tax=Streptomyces spirodelae TaxID=2812904 RepID=A0ABS3WWV9_9ACTN|nr:MBL fold metallo-hydrolase [Streptomyces spirodelae]MBO8187624.1 MBL fold metallo-hydrolase [Streptomyces spirodelae]
MEPQPVRPFLHVIPFAVGQAYLWRDGEEISLIDTGPPGGADAVEDAIRHCGAEPAALRRIVLTHFHLDHTGSAAELATRHGAEVVAHRADAPVVRGRAPAPPPDMAGAPEWERAVFDQVHAPFGITADAPAVPPAPPCRVDREVDEGDVLEFGGGATVLSVPGHTQGSLALLLPEHRTLFTGDTVAWIEDAPAPGVFNQDRARTMTAFQRLCALSARESVETVCFGHGAPLATGGGETLAQAAAAHS